MCFLSIIIPVYNVEQYIEECFDSLIKQIDEEAEIICIDDGSTDNSGVICDKYAAENQCFTVIHTTNKGVAAARNYGLRVAQGQYIAWVDPDDYVYNNWYQSILLNLKEKRPDLLIFDYKIYRNGIGKNKIYNGRSMHIDKLKLLHDLAVDQKIQSQLWQKIFKKELFEGIVFPEQYKCMEDYAVLHKIVEKCTYIYYLQQILYCYRVRNDSLVTEVDLKKTYDCYLIARDRYKYLSKKYPDISKIGYLIQGLGFCIQFNKCKQIVQVEYLQKYRYINTKLKHQISGVMMNNDVSWHLKLKFLCVYFDVLKIAMKVYRMIRKVL